MRNAGFLLESAESNSAKLSRFNSEARRPLRKDSEGSFIDDCGKTSDKKKVRHTFLAYLCSFLFFFI